MKKILLLIISFLMFTNSLEAASKPYLTSLEVTNGVNTLNFDKNNDLYTINVYQDVDALDISYKVSNPDTKVEIIGNELKEEVNDIYINLEYGNDKNSYHLIVNKINDAKPVFYEINPNNIKKDNKLMQLVIIILYVFINYILVKLLFHKKRIH